MIQPVLSDRIDRAWHGAPTPAASTICSTGQCRVIQTVNATLARCHLAMPVRGWAVAYWSYQRSARFIFGDDREDRRPKLPSDTPPPP